jgi:hypothetical protein
LVRRLVWFVIRPVVAWLAIREIGRIARARRRVEKDKSWRQNDG